MVDRIATRPYTNKIDLRLQTLLTSPYAQQQLQLAGLISHRGQIVTSHDYLRSLSQRKRERREREAIKQEIVIRTLKIDQNNRRSRRHQSDLTARRAVNSNSDTLSRQYRKQSYGRKKSREKSAPGYLSKSENDGEQRIRVTSAYKTISKINKDLSESDYEQNHIELLDKPHVLSVERHVCEVTMFYGLKPTTKNGQPARDEIVVMQQHTTGENLVIYRGFLTEGESFSFKSQRRSTSPLSLAFYAKGFIDSVINDCCEFKYGRRNQHINQHSRFLIEQVRKASPCENCRRKYFQRALTPNVNTTPSDTARNDSTQNVLQCFLTSTPELSIDNQEYDSSEKPNLNAKEHHRNKKITQHKKHKDSVNTMDENGNKDKQLTDEQKNKKLSSKSSSQQHLTREQTASVDFSLLEYTLLQEQKPSKKRIPRKSNNPSIMKRNSIKHNAEISPKETTSLVSSQGTEYIQTWPNETDIIPWDTHSSADSFSTVGAKNIFQMSMTQIQQQQLQDLSHQSSSIRMVRLEKSVENFIYILDSNIQISNVDKTKLRGIINFGFIFNYINDKICIEFITQIVNEQIILILSSTTMKNLDRNIRDASQIHSIYIIDDIKDYSNDFEKIRGIYPNITNIWDQLEKDIALFTNDLSTILSIPAGDTSDSTFAYIQVLKDILLETDEKTDLKKQMLDFCRQVYADNDIQLRFIDEFEHHFRPDEAVKWYIRQETFLFKMLTRAFRIPEPDLLFNLRFFIQYLHHQLKSNFFKTSTIVYYIQHISNDNFDIILKNQGGFLAFSPFILTNKTKIIQQQQQQRTTGLSFNNSEFKLVLFQMELGTTIPKIDIETSHKQVFISAATIFRISNVKQTNKKIPIVKLTSNDDVLQAIQEVTKNVREAAHGSFPLLRMAKLMKQMEYIQHTKYFCLMLMDDPITVDNEIANLIVGELFHTLGSFYYEQEQYDHALEQLQNSLTVYLRVLPLDDIKLTPTYNNIGSICHKQGLDKQALQFHMKAYNIQVKSSNSDPESIATYAGNIASVLVKQGKYDEAISFLQHDLQIREQFHPNGDDINLAVKYHSLAGAQFKIGQYTEALENYKHCLEIELKLHPKTHPTVAVTYYNIATTLEALEQLKEGIETIQKAIARLLLTKDTNDEEVQMYKEYEKSLQQKLSIKSLYGTT
ncbi:unnamed protein product [Rotaria sordida]|uniref:DUF4590 domain-containing protein n=1 Tax=Rotaria sordida TaxID=392033 RepID=A0A819K4A1_9BILA|nr:unnamed protein product [Rotaria sordida]